MLNGVAHLDPELMSSIRSAAHRFAILSLLAFVFGSLAACDSGTTTSAGIDLDRLFAVPTASEIQAVQNEWDARSNPSRDAEIVAQTPMADATIYIVSHTQMSADGADFKHYGIVRIPNGAATWPIVMYHHSGDNGLSVSGTLGVYERFPQIEANTVLVAPVFRSETLDANFAGLDTTFVAGGMASPLDYDVDDSIGLLNATLELFPAETDAERIGVFGISRGGATAVLHALRDDRVDVITDYFGPTDFFNLGARVLALNALLGTPAEQTAVRSLPGGDYLVDEILIPLDQGTYSYDDARLELVRRSPGFYGSMLPSTQLHHHVQDGVVSVQFSEAFIALIATNPVNGTFEASLYGEGGATGAQYHSPTAMPESIPATDQFLYDHLFVPTASAATAF